MKKCIILLTVLTLACSARSEWFQVQKVNSYNQITAVRPNAPANAITIRIKNLENIEDIQMNRTKVLFSGKSAQDLARNCLEGQLVWIEDLQEESGIHVGHIYLSYEQVVRAFAAQRMVGGQTLSPEIKAEINKIYGRMMRQLDTTSAFENDELLKQSHQRAKDSREVFSFDVCYTHDYLKGIFIYEALDWFKNTGQFLPETIQELYIKWVGEYQNAPDQRARAIEMKIRGLTVRYELFEDFIFDQ